MTAGMVELEKLNACAYATVAIDITMIKFITLPGLFRAIHPRISDDKGGALETTTFL